MIPPVSPPSPETKAAGPGRPKDPGKRAAILDAAKRLFVSQGFERVSMDQIATEAGVSKLTVYSHFGDKNGLLSAVVQAHCEREMPIELFEPAPDQPLRERLLEIAGAFFAMINCPETIAGHRMLCAPQSLSPDLPRSFWEAGPARIQRGLSELLARRSEAGELAIEDAGVAARHFFALLKGEPHARLMIGYPVDMDAAATERHLSSVVDLFLRAHRPERP